MNATCTYMYHCVVHMCQTEHMIAPKNSNPKHQGTIDCDCDTHTHTHTNATMIWQSITSKVSLYVSQSQDLAVSISAHVWRPSNPRNAGNMYTLLTSGNSRVPGQNGVILYARGCMKGATNPSQQCMF